MLIMFIIGKSALVWDKASHRVICGDKHDNLGGGENVVSLWIVFSSPAILSQLSCCLSLPICFLNAMLLEAHQPWSVSCYRREVKRRFQLLSYWLRPPSGQARPSVNPALNERRSLPTEEVSLWVYVMCPPALTRQIGSARGGGCVFEHMCAMKVCFYVSSSLLHLTFPQLKSLHTHIIFSQRLYISLSSIWVKSVSNWAPIFGATFDVLFNRACCPFALQLVFYCSWPVQ